MANSSPDIRCDGLKQPVSISGAEEQMTPCQCVSAFDVRRIERSNGVVQAALCQSSSLLRSRKLGLTPVPRNRPHLEVSCSRANSRYNCADQVGSIE